MYQGFSCKKCSLSITCVKHILPKDPQPKDILLVLNYPTVSQNILGRLEDNKTWNKVLSWLSSAGISTNQVHFTSLLRCYYDKNKHKESEFTKAKQACFSYVKKEIEIVKPKVIVAIGKDAFEMFGGSDFGKHVGKFLQTLAYSQPIFPVYPPAFFEREGNNNFLVMQEQAFRKIKNSLSAEIVTTGSDYGWIDTIEKLYWLKEQLDSNNFTYDIEGNSLDFFKNETTGIGFSWKRQQGRYLPLLKYIPIFGLSPYWGDKQNEVIEILRAIMSNGSSKGAHNGKFDNKSLFHEFGIIVNNFAVDSMLLVSMVRPGLKRYGLDALSQEYADLSGYKETVKGKDLGALSIQDLAIYNNKDTDLCFRLIEDNIDKLDEGTQSAFHELLMPLSDLTMRIEYFGYRIDTDYAYEFHCSLYEELGILQAKIDTALNRKINIRSSDQLGDVLYNILKLPVLEKTKGGAPSTEKEVLKELLEKTKNPVLADILKFRSLAATKGTFIDGFVPQRIRKDNQHKDYLLDKSGYYHGNFKLAWANTGRLSSGREEGMEEGNFLNLQNIPRDKRFRRMYLPDEGMLFIGADHAQLELRVLAHLCQDRNLLSAFEQDYDPHSYVAATMMGLDYEEVVTGYRGGVDRYVKVRDASKNVGFGWVYGAGDGKFAFLFPGNTDAMKQRAEKEAKERYFDRFNRIIPWKNQELENARKNGFVRTLSGRKIIIDNLNIENRKLRSHAERQAINALVQNPASDLTAMGAVDFDRWLTKNDVNGRVLNLIHDAIYSCVEAKSVSKAYWAKKQIMEQPRFGIKSKLKADIKISDRWEGKSLTSEYIK